MITLTAFDGGAWNMRFQQVCCTFAMQTAELDER